MPGVEGKVVVITGAGSGMGAADAELLAAGGAKVVLGDLREDRLAEVAATIVEAGGDVSHLVTDVRRLEEVQGLVTLARERYGKLDVIISNAGVMPLSPLEELRVDDWELMLDVNVKGVLNGIAAALPIFNQQGFGHFVHMASTAAYLTLANQAVYSASKYAVRALSEGLRKEAGGHIRVTVVSPGYTNTNFADTVTNVDIKAQLTANRDAFALSPTAIARVIAFAIEQSDKVDISEIVVRSTAQR